MKTTIDAMKQAQTALEWPQNEHECTTALIVLAEAISREEAQTVEPMAISDANIAGENQASTDEFFLRGKLASELTCWHRLTAKESDELVSLFSSRISTSPPDKKRRLLIKRLRSCAEISKSIVLSATLNESADMLAADAQFVPGTCKELNAIHAVIMSIGSDWPEVDGDSYSLYHVKRMARDLRAAQQVAVPQWWKPDPIGEVFAHQPMGCFLVRPIGSEAPTLALGDKLYLAATPQPLQAERVPMTDVEIADDYLAATNQYLRQSDKRLVTLMVRAIEAHYGIGVKK